MPQLGPQPFLHPNATVRNSQLGAFVEIGEGSNILESEMGDYSYMDFVKVGIPLNLITWAVAMVAIPMFFPF